MRSRFLTPILVGGIAVASLLPSPVVAQHAQALPADDLVRPSGQGVAPVFEGWYEDPDGEAYILSFGYLNRNSEEILRIPLADRNRLAPAKFDGLQPTRFLPRRWWGVFAVRVPPDFDGSEVRWAVDARGEGYEIPGRITNANYKIDALHAPATGLTPPLLAFEPGQEGRGPLGVRSRARSVRVGEDLTIEIWTRDDTWGARRSGEGRAGDGPEPRDVTLRWLQYSGPGEVVFGEQEMTVQPRSGRARIANTVTFDEPGEYIVYIRADNEDMRSAGMEQCCWTNGYVPVRAVP